MNKFVILFSILLFFGFRSYSSERAGEKIDYLEVEFFKTKHQAKTIEQKSVYNLNHIFVGSCLLSYSPYFILSILGAFFTIPPRNQTDRLIFISFSVFPIVFFLGSFIPGLILLLRGNKNYYSRKQMADPAILTPLLEKKRESLQKMALISGIVNGAGLAFGGAGAGMICGSLFGGYQKELSFVGEMGLLALGTGGGYQRGLFISGIVLAAVGGTALAVCLPMMITSMAMSGWLKGEMNRLSLEISFVPEEKSSARGSSLSPWENSRLSLALKVRF